jgi:hypothetical protein
MRVEGSAISIHHSVRSRVAGVPECQTASAPISGVLTISGISVSILYRYQDHMRVPSYYEYS